MYGRRVRCEDNTCQNKTEKLFYSQKCSLIQKIGIKLCNFIGWHLGMEGIGKHMLWYVNPNNYSRLKKYYSMILKEASCVIFAGGGIIECSTNHDYYHHIDLITMLAEKVQIPVYFNAVGMVIDYHHMFGWSIMRRALNRRCIRSISCRDGQDWINHHIFSGKAKAYPMPCCAVYSADAYEAVKNPESNMIGIGVIRGNVFTSYGKQFTEVEMLELYKKIVEIILMKGWRCCIFTNGYSGDIKFARKLCHELGREDIIVKDCPESSQELVATISQFRGMITARLHSCIVAYSLQIPTIAISWTDKVKDFMTLAGEKDCAIDLSSLNAEEVVSRFEKIMMRSYDNATFSKIRETVIQEIERIRNEIF